MKFALLLSCCVAGQALAAEPSLKYDSLKYEKWNLDNGLEVIVSEDHRLPLVAVQMTYHVGALNERAGRSGFAHLFEHLMFQGSKHVDDEQHIKLLSEAGGSGVNASTGFDTTDYVETVPANALELALWLESDRMGFLLDAVDRKKLDNQRDVVKNERRQRIENSPYGLVGEQITKTLYPASHPYSGQVIGSMADLSAATLGDVAHFFRTYYAPANATLALAGDVTPAQARALVEKYFGGFAKRPPPPAPAVSIPAKPRAPRLTLEEQVGKLTRVYFNWITPPSFAPGDAELDFVGMALTEGKASRLYKALVIDKKLAQTVQAYQESRAAGSVFQIVATALPGVKGDALERAMNEVLAELVKRPIDDAELTRIKNRYETDYIVSLGSYVGRARVLQTANHYLKDPGGWQKEFERHRRLSTRDLGAAVKAHLSPANRLTVIAERVPRGQQKPTAAPPPANPPTNTANGAPAGSAQGTPPQAGAAANGTKPPAPVTVKPPPMAPAVPGGPAPHPAGAPPPPPRTASAPVGLAEEGTGTAANAAGLAENKDEPFRATPPRLGPPAKFKLPTFARATLKNGMSVLVAENHDLPLVAASFAVRAGATLDPPDKPGLAHFVFDLLDEGAKDKDAIGIDLALAALGTSAGTYAMQDGGFISAVVLKANLAPLVEIIGDMALGPTFPEKSVEQLRGQRLSEWLASISYPNRLGLERFVALLFGETHPYGHPRQGNEASIESITRTDIAEFYRGGFAPERAALVLAGDITLDEARALAEKKFGAWPKKGVTDAPITLPKPSLREKIFAYAKPDAPQTFMVVGAPTFAVGSPDETALTLVSDVLAGQFSSRLNLNLREDKGITYGVQSQSRAWRSAGMFIVASALKADATGLGVKETFAEIERLKKKPISKEELAFVKNASILSYPSNFESLFSVLQAAAHLFLYGLPLDHYQRELARVEKLSLKEVQRVAEKYLAPGRLQLVLVGDPDVIRHDVEPLGLGKVEVLQAPGAGEPTKNRAAHE